MKATILVPTYDDEKTIGAVVAGLRGLDPAPEHQIIVVDDASTDATADRAARAGGDGIRLVRHERNLGLAASMNEALGRAEGEFLVIVQSDCAVRDPGWLARMLEPFADPRVGAVVSCREIEDRARLPVGARLFNAVCPQDLRGSGDTGGVETADFFRGKADAYRLDLVRGLGGWDSDTFLFAGEDTDLSLRMRNTGYRIVLSNQARVTMLFSSRQDTAGKALRKAILYGSVAYPLLLRHGYDGLQTRTYLLCLTCLVLSPLLLWTGKLGLALSVVLAVLSCRTRFSIVRLGTSVPFAAIPLALAGIALAARTLLGIPMDPWRVLPGSIVLASLAYPLYVAAKAARREMGAAPGLRFFPTLAFAFAWRLLSGVGYAIGWARSQPLFRPRPVA